jgi:hypothetical protein
MATILTMKPAACVLHVKSAENSNTWRISAKTLKNFSNFIIAKFK